MLAVDAAVDVSLGMLSQMMLWVVCFSLARILNDLELPVCLLSTLSNNPHGRF